MRYDVMAGSNERGQICRLLIKPRRLITEAKETAASVIRSYPRSSIGESGGRILAAWGWELEDLLDWARHRSCIGDLPSLGYYHV